jgi:hypothetical protein
MPPISPQGSRTGLVTALVIFVILFVTTTILWIYESAERRNRDDRIGQLDARMRDVVDEATIGGPDVAALQAAAKENPAYSGMSAMQVALAQRNDLAKRVAGTATSPAQVTQRAEAALRRATADDVKAANAQVTPTTSLADAVTRLAERLAALNAERDAMAKDRDTAQAETKQAIADREKLLRQKDEEIAKVTKQTQDQLAQLASFQQSTEGTVEQIRTSSNTTLTQSQQQNEQLTAQLAQATANIKDQQNTIAKLQERLRGVRVNPNEATVQKADGEIVRLPGNNLAVINLGLGDQIVQGMTFEVYDKHQGVPALGADGSREGEMPTGKASLEVVRIGPGFSECRIIRKDQGHNLVQGDLVVNLVYDKTQKYNFVVYGDFDLDRDGRASAGDAEVVRRLITQWGGNVVNDVNVNTDFIVMGVEPAVPAAPAADAGAVEIAAHQRAVQALDRYLEVRKQAMSLNIPILNQNRFLNFVGYSSQAGR